MDLNRLLLWMAGVSCSLNLLFTFRGSGLWGWRAILIALLATLFVGVATVPQIAGYLVGGGWFLFVLLPAIVQRLVNRLLVRRRYAAALVMAKVSAWLHPFDAWTDHPDIIRALRHYHEGKTDEATALINRLGRLNSAIGRLAVVMRAQQTGDWEQFLNWLKTLPPETADRDDNLLLARLQALGELGHRQEMLHAYERFLSTDEDDGADLAGAVTLRVAALAGLHGTVDVLADAMSASLPHDAEQYWRLTARQVSGGTDVSEEFRRLRGNSSPYLTSMITRRINQPLPPLVHGELDAAAIRTRDRISERVAHETQYAVMGISSRRRPYTTWSIAVVLIGVYLLEANMAYLFQLGAMVIPTSATPGQWWRIFTAGVLHAGPIHLGMNILGLLYLGPRLERAWGPWRMLTCYIVSTVGSMAFAPFLTWIPPPQQYVPLVGASGGVMGLLGAIIGHLTVGWWRGRSRRVTRQLGILLLLVCLQTSFDLSTPNVSFACHALGLTIGFAFAVAIDALRRPAVPA